jgi:tetratricopeptide (TPR) repeat protein
LTRFPHLTKRQGFWLALTLLFCLLAGVPAEASGRKARQLWEQGRKAELVKDYDKALELYELALVEDPKDPRYQLTVYRIRFVTGQAYLHRARQLRDEGHLE